MEYCCHISAGASSCYLELLDKLQKWICRTVDPSCAASLEPLAHRRNAVFSVGIFLVDVHLNWLNWFNFFIFEVSLLVFLIDCTTIPRYYKYVYVNRFFPRAARILAHLWSSLPIECFPLTYDPVSFNLFVLLFLETPCTIVAVQPCMERILIKRNSPYCLPKGLLTSL